MRCHRRFVFLVLWVGLTSQCVSPAIASVLSFEAKCDDGDSVGTITIDQYDQFNSPWI